MCISDSGDDLLHCHCYCGTFFSKPQRECTHAVKTVQLIDYASSGCHSHDKKGGRDKKLAFQSNAIKELEQKKQNKTMKHEVWQKQQRQKKQQTKYEVLIWSLPLTQTRVRLTFLLTCRKKWRRRQTPPLSGQGCHTVSKRLLTCTGNMIIYLE